jgi:AsmA protein
MKPWLRNTLIGVGALIVLLVVGAAVLIATFDANRFKGLAIDYMKNERQRTLVIDGPIELSVFPRLAVKVSKVKLSEHKRADEFLAVGEAALAVQTWPLLRKQLVVDRVSARGVRAVYVRDANGKSNIDDLTAGTADPNKPAAPAPSGGPALRFDISGVTLDDVQLTIRDAMTPLEGRVAVQSLKTGRLAHQSETPVSLKAALDLTKPQPIKLALDGNTTLALDLDRSAVSLSAMKLGVQLDGAGFKDVALGASGAAGWDGSAVRAGPLKLEVQRGAREGLTLSPSSLEVKQLLFSTANQKLELDALKLALAGRRGADAPFELALDWPQLAVDAHSLKGSALSGNVKLSGPTSLTAKFQSGAPSGKFDALKLPAVQLAMQGQMQQRKVDGTLKADLLVNAGKGAVAIDALDLKATLADPGLQPLQLAVRGNARADAKAASWKLDGALNTNKFDINGQVALDRKVPHITAQARFDSLDLNKVLAPGKPGAAPQAASGPAPADTPVALDGLNAVDGKFNVSAASFAFRQYKVSDVKIDATLESGVLRIARLAGRAWGGAIDANGMAEAKSQRVAVKLNADNVNVNALLKDVAGKDLLEGTGRVVADVATHGATVGAMRSNLAGSAGLRLANGAVKGVNLARSFRQAKAALGGSQDTSTAANATEKTDFSEMSASARIAGGVAQSDDLDVKSPFLRIGGAGKFDVGRGNVDYTARATVVDTSKGQEGAELAALKGVTVPVKLSGPFEAIDYKIQWSQVAAAALENKLKDKLSEKLGAKLGLPAPGGAQGGAASAPQQQPQSSKDKLRDRLKGLIK